MPLEIDPLIYPFPLKVHRLGSLHGDLLPALARCIDEPAKFDAYADLLYSTLRRMALDKEMALVAALFEREMQASCLASLGNTDDNLPLRKVMLKLQLRHRLFDDPIRQLAKPQLAALYAEHGAPSGDIQRRDAPPHLVAAIANFTYIEPGILLKPGTFAEKLDLYLAYAGFQQSRFLSLYLLQPAAFTTLKDTVERSLGLEIVKRKRNIKTVRKDLIELTRKGLLPQELDIDGFLNGCLRQMDWVKPRDFAFLRAWVAGNWTAEQALACGVDLDGITSTLIKGIAVRKIVPEHVENLHAFYQSVASRLSPAVNQQVLNGCADLLKKLPFKPYKPLTNLARTLTQDGRLEPEQKIAAYAYRVLADDTLEEGELMPYCGNRLAVTTKILRAVAPNETSEMKLYRTFDLMSNNPRRVKNIKRKAIQEDFGL